MEIALRRILEMQIYYLDQWIVLTKGVGILITTQFVWNVDLLPLFQFKDELLLHESSLPQNCANEEDVI